jgi:glutamate-1-semialdehyde aminotransferase
MRGPGVHLAPSQLEAAFLFRAHSPDEVAMIVEAARAAP